MPSINGAFLSLSLSSFSLSFSLFARTANVPDSTSFSSTLLGSNLVEFSWVDILLSSRAYLYLAFESLPVHLLGLQTAPSHRRSTPCTRRKRKRERERYSPSSPIRDGGLSLYFGFARLTEDAEDPYPLRRGIRETEATGKGLSRTPRGTYAGPTFDLYRPLSIFCNLLLRILNVRIASDRRAEERAWCGETRRQQRRGIKSITNSSFCYRPRRGEMPP